MGEKHSTLDFHAVASHATCVLMLSKLFAGATKDKSIARYDLAMEKVRGKSELIDGLE